MSEIAMILINLFFVPVISLQIHRRTVIHTELSGKELFIRYCLYTVLNILPTRGILWAMGILLRVSTLMSSAWYTVAAILSAVVLPWIILLVRKFISIRFEVKKNEKA